MDRDIFVKVIAVVLGIICPAVMILGALWIGR